MHRLSAPGRHPCSMPIDYWRTRWHTRRDIEWHSPCSQHLTMSCHIVGIPLTNHVIGRGGELADAGTRHLTATGCLAAFQLGGVARRITIRLRCDELHLNVKCHDWSWGIVSGQKVKKLLSDHEAHQKSWRTYAPLVVKLLSKPNARSRACGHFSWENYQQIGNPSNSMVLFTNYQQMGNPSNSMALFTCYVLFCNLPLHPQPSRTRGTVLKLPGRYVF